MFKMINDLIKPFNLEFSNEQLSKLQIYYDILIEYNKKTNLTKITEVNEVLIKHFFDSISPAFYFDFSNKRIIDIGAGAGFPSIPLKILFPNIDITLLDSSVKRTTFLELVKRELNLDEIHIIHARAEEIAKNNLYREAYDIAISRAVARLNVLSELALPFVKIGGCFISLKGSKASEEILQATRAVKVLGGEIYKKQSFKLPMDNGDRMIIFIKKNNSSPIKYPRKPGEPNRKPIN